VKTCSSDICTVYACVAAKHAGEGEGEGRREKTTPEVVF